MRGTELSEERPIARWKSDIQRCLGLQDGCFGGATRRIARSQELFKRRSGSHSYGPVRSNELVAGSLANFVATPFAVDRMARVETGLVEALPNHLNKAARCPTSSLYPYAFLSKSVHSTSNFRGRTSAKLRAIKRYLATRTDELPWLFVSERGQPMTRQAVNYIVRLAGEKAKLGRVWPHMLRHSCGYYLADQGTDLRTIQDYLGHRDPKHTAHYTRVAGHWFEGLWK